jgi:hypothetical protein
MADYGLPFAPASYRRPERYQNPYVGTLLELMQGQARAQAAADERRMALAGQRWQGIAQAGADVARAFAEAPERRRQQELQRVQYDQVMRQRDIQTALDNLPTDPSQWEPYLTRGTLTPAQRAAVQAQMLTLSDAAKKRSDAALDVQGLSAATSDSYSAYLDAQRRAGRLTDAQFGQLLAARANRLTQPGAPDWSATDEADRQAVVAASPAMQTLRAKAAFDVEADARKPYTLNPGDRRIVPGAAGQPDRVIEGGPRPLTAEENMMAAYRSFLGLEPGATLTPAQLVEYPRWRASQGQSSAPPSDLARAIARYADSMGKRPDEVTYAEELTIRKQLDEAARDPRAPVLPVIIQGPDGLLAVTRPGNGGAPRATPVLGPNQQPVPRTPSGAERLSAANDAATLALLTDIERSMSDEWIGPVAGRWAQATKNLPLMGPSDAQATFYANVATLRNQIINLLAGAAVSAAEERRMLDQLPDPIQNASVFRANLAATKRNRERLLSLKTTGTVPDGDAGTVTVTAPDGSTHAFATQAEADAFKRLAGIP